MSPLIIPFFRRCRQVPVLLQRDSSECATTCLAMVMCSHGLPNTQSILRKRARVSSRGVDLATLVRLAAQFGFSAEGVKTEIPGLPQLPLPAIAHVDGNHYVVVTSARSDRVVIHDPAFGPDELSMRDFATRASGVYLLIRATGIDAGTETLRQALRDQREHRRKLWETFYSPPTQAVRGLIATAVAVSLVLQMAGLVFPLSTQWFIDAVSAGRARRDVLLYALSLAAAGLLLLAGSALRNHVLLRAQVRWETRFFERVLHHFVTLAPETFESYRREDFLYRLQTNQVVRQIFSASNLQSMLDVFLVVGYLLLLHLYSSRLGALAVLAVSVSLLLAWSYGSANRRLKRRYLQTSIRTAASLTDTLLGIMTVKLLGIEQARFDHWRERHTLSVAAAARSYGLSFELQWLLQAVALAAQLGVYVAGTYLVYAHHLTIGQFVGFLTIFLLVLVRSQALSEAWLGFSEMQVGLARINDLLIHQPEISLAPTAGSGPACTPERGAGICAMNLGFQYSGSGRHALANFSCDIAAGSHIALVGRNGSGKSTLLKIVAGLYENYTGELRIDDVDAKRFDRQRHRRTVAMIPQDVHVFEGSVRANLLMTSPSASDSDLLRALKCAELDPHDREAGIDLDHVILPGAANLSGGQRLRLAFARLLLLEPSVIVLDEATSALDAEAEQRVMDAVFGEFYNRTIIYAAHRLNTVVRADRILVLDAGRLVQDGKHEELVSFDGVYARLSDAFNSRSWTRSG